jgi:hypothetical protein
MGLKTIENNATFRLCEESARGGLEIKSQKLPWLNRNLKENWIAS